MAISDNKPLGIGSPGFAPEIAGAPNVGLTMGGASSPATAASTEVKVSTDVENKGAEEAKDAPPTDTEAASAASTTDQNNIDTAGSDRKIRTLQDYLDQVEPPETAEQRKKRERREKSAKIISAVSDGLMAMSNLYFTSQYAPNMYNHERSSQLSAQNAAIEKAKKDREANADKYLRFALSLGDAENERAKTVREAEAEQERRKLAREKAERDAEAHGWKAEAHGWEAALQDDRKREQAGKANKAEQEAITAQAEAENAPAMQQAKLETEKARKGSYQASADASRASAAAHGRSNVAEFTAYDETGKAHPFHTAAAAEAFARRHGTWYETEEEETTKTETKRTPESKPQTRISTKRKKGGYAGKPSPTGGKPSPTA